MTIVAIERNGIGLGHQARLASICEALRMIKQTPVLLCQGSAYGQFLTGHPIWTAPCLSTTTDEGREIWRRNLERYPALSDPPVIIEDTHPSGIPFSSLVRRILVVRPLSFGAMMNLLQVRTPFFDHYIIAD